MKKKDFREYFQILKRTTKEYISHDPFDLAAVVAFYAIFSIPGLLMIVVSVAGWAFGEEAVTGRISKEIAEVIGPDAGKEVENLVIHAYEEPGTTMAAIFGIATLLFGATAVLVSLQRTLNRLWDVQPDPRKAGILKLVIDRLTSFGLIVVMSFLLLISLTFTTLLGALRDFISGALSGILHLLIHIFHFIFSFGVIVLIFALVFKFLPDIKISWKTVWSGAFFTGILFLVGEFFLGLFFSLTDQTSAYGAAGSFILILFWIYYACMILFFGAQFTREFSKRTGMHVKPADHAKKGRDENRSTLGPSPK